MGALSHLATVANRAAQRWATLGAAAAVVAAGAFVLRFDPTDRIADPTGPCLWHSITGVNGPGCGGTRMFYYLLHGDLAQAARHHLAALVAVPFVAYLGLRWAATVWLGRELPALRLSPRVYAVYIGAFLLYSTVLRNLPWAPFTWFDIPNLTP
ncbi:DUF2752 domain-containing protein [Micromonospora thermarum]|uniref:DUF2752 domain-containing protein n=1 Tax=Micromonospora thermarum TaxID=2720024 RepID=A0ABX0ZFT3_9ACTN|nr:DUF2752 domain-containing protein [Micromonospora thermarum]NJP35804.1 DUF2752 domain-containing protein [Micromonospora thermarum]